MKKCLIVLLLFMIVFTGCSSPTSKDNELDTEQSQEKEN